MELFPFLIKRLLMNLFQGQFVPLHYATLLWFNGHAHWYLLTLPTTRVFPFFGVKASFGDDSLSWRFTFGRRKCLVESPKWQQMQKKKLDQIFLSQQIPCSNGAISFPHATSPEEFVSRPLCVMCIILHEICTPTYGNRRFLVLFILPGWKIVIAT